MSNTRAGGRTSRRDPRNRLYLLVVAEAKTNTRCVTGFLSHSACSCLRARRLAGITHRATCVGKGELFPQRAASDCTHCTPHKTTLPRVAPPRLHKAGTFFTWFAAISIFPEINVRRAIHNVDTTVQNSAQTGIQTPLHPAGIRTGPIAEVVYPAKIDYSFFNIP